MERCASHAGVNADEDLISTDYLFLFNHKNRRDTSLSGAFVGNDK